MEKWDLYNEKREKLNKIVQRGDRLEDNEYHLVINAWLKNEKGEFLIVQRAPNKTYPYMWECVGGSAIIGEDSLDAVVREVKEETGIDIDKTNVQFIGTALRYYPGCPDILDVWIVEDNTPIENVVVQEEEVCNVKWASAEEIKELYKNKQFEANAFFEDIIG